MTQTLQDKELQAHYEDLFVMFGTPGWKRLMEQVAEMVVTGNSLSGVDTQEQLWFRKGELAQMLWLESLQRTHEVAYNDLLSQQEGGEATPATGGKAQIVETDPLS